MRVRRHGGWSPSEITPLWHCSRISLQSSNLWVCLSTTEEPNTRTRAHTHTHTHTRAHSETLNSKRFYSACLTAQLTHTMITPVSAKLPVVFSYGYICFIASVEIWNECEIFLYISVIWFNFKKTWTSIPNLGIKFFLRVVKLYIYIIKYFLKQGCIQFIKSDNKDKCYKRFQF